jgi:hypothetical protein
MASEPKFTVPGLSSRGDKDPRKLREVERKLFTFEVNETIDPSRLVVEFLDRCNQCIEHGKTKHSWEQVRKCHCIAEHSWRDRWKQN